MKKTPLNRGKGSLKKSPLKRKVGGKNLVNKTPLKNQKSKLKQTGLKKSVANKSRKRNLKRKQIRKNSTNPLSREIKLCDAAFSRFIRLSNSDSKGNVKCYTCDFVGYWKQNSIQNGHFISRNSMMCRWLKLNNHPQCEKCNMLLSGNLKVYAENLKKEYGPGIIEYLEKEGKKISKLSVEKVRQLREYFEAQVILLKAKLEK